MAMITASVFNGTKPPPSSFLKNLVVTGGVEAVGNKLKAMEAWNGCDPICCPIITFNEGDGAIKTGRWALLLQRSPRRLLPSSCGPLWLTTLALTEMTVR